MEGKYEIRWLSSLKTIHETIYHEDRGEISFFLLDTTNRELDINILAGKVEFIDVEYMRCMKFTQQWNIYLSLQVLFP